MSKQRNKHKGKFWSGFAMGTMTAVAFSHFISNKEHRGSLKKFLEYLDEEKDALIDPNHFMYLAQNYISSQQSPVQLSEKGEKQDEDMTPSHQKVNTLLDKMKDAFNEKKQVKKYFVKEGKFISKG